MSDNLGHLTHFRYDTRGNCIDMTDAIGNAHDMNYSIADQVVNEFAPPTGQSGTGRASRLDTYLYPGGPVMQNSAYDESNTLLQDGGGNPYQVISRYGAEGEMLSVSGATEATACTYDALYRVSTTADGNNHSATYIYSPVGYLSAIQYPKTSGAYDTIQFPNYDANGNILKRIDGRGIETDLTYNDPESKVTSVHYPSSPAIDTAANYDAYGRCHQFSDGTGVTTYSYDDRNTCTSVSSAFTGLPALTISYDFYPNGKRQAMHTPAGTFSYTYDAAARMTALSNPVGQSWAWTYLDNGVLQSQQASNGVTTAYSYNSWGQVTAMAHQGANNALYAGFNGAVYNPVACVPI